MNNENIEQVLDDLIDLWHERGAGELHEFLGMTWEEYTKYVEYREIPSRMLETYDF